LPACAGSKRLVKMPKELKGTIFTEVIPQMLPEIDFARLLQIGTIARAKKKTLTYESLRASLRKIQWVKFVGLRAVEIEQDIQKQMEPDQVLMDPIGQIDHSLAITDLVIHTKSALDSMAIFLTDLLRLDAKVAKRDLKKPEFRSAVKTQDPIIGSTLDQLESWFEYVQKVRDEWIHRDSIRSFVVSGPSDVGALPIPREPSLFGKLPPDDLQITSKDFWSTQEFLEYHYSRLVTLFRVIVERSISIEMSTLKDTVPSPDPAEVAMARQGCLFPTRVTKAMTVKRMKVSSLDLSTYYERLSKIFRPSP